MNSSRNPTPILDESTIPAEIYIPLVDSLFQEGRALLIGYFMVAGAMALTFWRTDHFSFLGCAAVFTLIAWTRALDMRVYARVRATVKTRMAARRWEHRYSAGAASSLATLGAWCWLALSYPNDEFALVVSFAITIAYVVGITGRNFGSRRLVIIQIMSVATPMIGALAIYGDSFYRAFIPLLALFFVGLFFICERLRRNLLDAVISSREVSLLAGRFDTAISNMPHGLCMFDADHRIVVANDRTKEHMGLPRDLDLQGLTPFDVVTQCVRTGILSAPNGNRLSRGIAERLSDKASDKFTIDLQDGRAVEFAIEPMDNRSMVLLVEDVTERKRAEAKINHMAHFDALTGLPNRAILHERLESAANGFGVSRRFAVHFIDLDQFKQVNDTLGHSRGDQLLQATAKRLLRAVKPSDTVARFGGDEFIVLQPIKDEDEASALAERILQALREPYDIDGNHITASASIGIALATESDADAERLLRNADMALYCAKTDSRNTWCFFKPEMETEARARRDLELDLRDALLNDAFEIHYQPIIDLRTHRVLACEALLRWPHPERGMISPGEFIPVAEEMGIITEIDQWVLQRACAECRQWPDGIAVTVNLSSFEFSHSDVPEMVSQALAASRLPASRLEIEITETILLQDTDRSRNALHRLRSLGVRVSLDDFGTKYSSLSYLHSFPLHKVKVDQSFVRNLKESRMTTLLRGIARLSAELGLRVAVEGVETEEQLDIIAADDSIDEVQGYLFGRPMTASALRVLLYASAPLRAGKVA